METNSSEIEAHPLLLEKLFAYKSKVQAVFRDVLGIHEIHHIALSHINPQNQLLCFSSTPAMEYNLFSSGLWQYDASYAPDWFHECRQASWQSLYDEARYDELYYLKQIKHHYPLGCSLAAKIDGMPFIFSLASKKCCPKTTALFQNETENFYKIGQYCKNLLYPLMTENPLAQTDNPHRLKEFAL